MSRTIDSRVVEMQFDNKQFESNVKTTMSTLDRLKQSLNMTGSYDSMSGLSGAVESVRIKFSALEVMAVTALANITNSAINAGKRIVSALTIDPIKAGFSEYETQINAVQTILANTASKGTTLNQVNAALDELNTYADKTIYNFTEMTRNIGTFTAAGVDLKTSVEAIKGIANLAAMSGSNAQQASTAMYQLSQALASGTIKLMDWNSVVNAGMGGQVFQDSLKETARVHGIAIDQMIESEGSFRETLSSGWLSAEILTETLAKFTGDLSEAQLEQMGYTKEQIVEIMKLGETANDAATEVKTFTQLIDTLKEAAQSGWSQSWKIIIGDFEEAKELWTEISDILGKIIGDSADARNKVLSGGLSSGWDQFLRQGISDEEGYKDAIKKVAKEHNIAIDEMIEKEGSFEATLKSGWLTSDIMSESLKNLTDKTKGLSDEQLEELGYTREQIDTLESLNESVQNGSVSIEEFAKKMTMASGRENLIQALRNAFEGLMSVIKPISEAFREIFPQYTGEQLYALTEKIRDLTASLKIGDETAKNIKDTFKGFFALLDIGKMALTAIAGGLLSLVKVLFPVTDNFLSVTGGVGDFIVAIRDALKSSNTFNVAIQNIGKVLKPVAEGIVMFTDLIASAFEAVRAPDMSGIDEFTGQIEERFQPLIKLGEAFKSFLSFFYNLASTIGEILSGLSASIFKSLNDANYNSIFDFINSGLFAAILYGIKKFIDSLTKITDSAGGFLSGITGILDGVTGCLVAFQSQLKAGVLLKIAISIGILAAALLTISMIDSEKLTTSLAAMTAMFVELFGAMAVFNAIAGVKGFFAINALATGMIGLSIAILILASAMKKLSSLDWNGVAKGLAAIAGLTGILVGATKLLETSSKSLIAVSAGFIIFGTAILILTQAVKQLGGLDLADLAKGLVGVGVLMAELVLFMKFADLSGMGAIKSVGILLLAAAITVLADAVKKLSSINLGDLVKGLSGLAVMLTSIAMFIKAAGNAKNVIATAASLTILSVAMNLFAAAIIKMGNMSWEEMGRGLISLGSALGVVTLALIALPKDIFIKSLALMDVAGAMLLLSQALKAFSSMSWEEIAKSLTSLIVSLGLIIGAFVLLSKTSSIVDALAFSVLAASIIILAEALKTIGSMSLAQIGIALTGLAGAFTVIGVAATLLTPAIPAILGLAAAIALLGVGVAAIGGGILALSAGLSALAVAGTAGTVALVALVTALIGLIPSAAKILAQGVIEFARVIGEGAPIIKDAFLVLLASALEAFTEAIPMITEAVFTLLISLLDALVKYTPDVVERVFDFLIGVLNAIAKKLPQLIQAGVDVLMAFFSGVIDALSGIDVEVLLKGIAGIGLLSAIMIALAAVASLVPAAMVGVLGMGVVIAELALVLAAIGALAQTPGLKWLINEGAELMQGVGNAIGSFIGGIVGGFMSGVSSNFPKIGSDLSAFMTNIQPFIEGAKSIDASTMDGVKALAETILILTAANILEGLTSWFTGGSSMTKFGKELAEFGPYFKNYYESIKGIDGSVVESSANAAKSLAEFAKEIPNSGGVVGWFAGENSLSAFAEELMEFGPKLKSYADSVKGLDASVVINSANAAKALAEMAANLPNSEGVVGWFTGENSLSVFAEELMDFGPKLKAYADSVRGLDSNVVVNSANAAKALAELSTNLPNTGGIVSWFAGDNDIASFGEKLVSFGQSFASYYTSVSTVNTAQLSGVVTEFKNLVDLANGIKSVDTSGMSTFSKNLEALGNAGIDGFINAFTNANSRVSAAANTMLTTFINSANAKKTDFYNAGKYLVEGFADGITANTFLAEARARAMAAAAARAAEKELDINSPSEVFKEIGDYVAAGLAIGIDKGTPKVEASSEKMTKKAVTAAEKAAAKTAKEAEKAAKDAFNLSVEWIDERKYYNELSLYEELDAWEWVQSRYLEGTEERKKADREVYRVKKEIAQADVDFAQRVIDVSRDAMDKRIQYEEEYYEACGRINDQLKRDIRDLNEQYDQALESRTKSLYDTYGLFDKIEPKDEVLGSDLIKNLRDQVNEFDEWTRQMSELSGKGVNSALIDELQKMGPKSLSEIKALNKLSEPELNEYVSLWREKSNQARTVAIKELEGLRIETSNKIRMLKEQARIDLEEQRLIFEEKTKQLAEETAKTIEDMKNDWLKKIGELRTKGEKDFKMFADNIVSIMSSPDWMGLGQDIVDGMKGGILSKASELAKAAAQTAIDALQAAKDAIGAASPSKKFAELGKWSMVGFAEGLKKYSHLGMSSAADMGMSTISTLKNVISAISDVINDNADINPVIRPVLDLSDVEAGSLLINDLLSKNKGINVADVIRKLPTFATSSESDGVNRSETPQEIKVSFVQNNYSPKALSRLEIYRQTKNQISTLRGLRGAMGTT